MKSTLVANSLWALEFSAKANGTIGSIQLKDFDLGPNKSSVHYHGSVGTEAERRYWSISNKTGYVFASVSRTSKTCFRVGRTPVENPRHPIDTWVHRFLFSFAEDSGEIAQSQLLAKFPMKNLHDLPCELRRLIAAEIGDYPFAPVFKARFGSIPVGLAEASAEVEGERLG